MQQQNQKIRKKKSNEKNKKIQLLEAHEFNDEIENPTYSPKFNDIHSNNNSSSPNKKKYMLINYQHYIKEEEQEAERLKNLNKMNKKNKKKRSTYSTLLNSDKKQQKRLFYMIYFGIFLYQMDQGLLPGCVIIMINSMQISIIKYGLIAILGLFGTSISSFFSYKIFINNMFCSKDILIFSIGGFSLFQLMFSLFNNIIVKIIMRFLSGLFLGPIVCYFKMRLKLFSGQKYNLFVFYYQIFSGIGFITGFFMSYMIETYISNTQYINWQFIINATLFILFGVGIQLKLTKQDLNIKYIKQIVKNEIKFDEMLQQPLQMERQQIKLQKGLNKQQIKLRLMNLQSYEGFLFNLRVLCKKKIYIISLALSSFRELIDFNLIFWIQYAYENVLDYGNVSPFTASLIILIIGLLIGFIIGYILQKKDNMRASQNIYLNIISLLISFVNIFIFFILSIFGIVNQYQTYIQYGITISCNCLVNPLIQGFIQSQIPNNLKVFSIGITTSIELFFGQFMGIWIGMLLKYNQTGLVVNFLIIAVFSFIIFLISYFFRGFIKKMFDDNQIFISKYSNNSKNKSIIRNPNIQFEDDITITISSTSNNTDNIHYEKDLNINQSLKEQVFKKQNNKKFQNISQILDLNNNQKAINDQNQPLLNQTHNYIDNSQL